MLKKNKKVGKLLISTYVAAVLKGKDREKIDQWNKTENSDTKWSVRF